ncbi:MAG: hypothetical protein K2M04_04620 [Muribaculaceae bacterium]|nr:hypothetical protein [Muribaculaceae bacterium]
MAATEIDGSMNNTPRNDMNGNVYYSENIYPSSIYASTDNERSRFLSFAGYYYYELSGKNTLTFTPTYIVSHTEQSSSYLENTFTGISNSATDNTNQLRANLSFTQNLGKLGNLLAFVRGNYEYNRTFYSGSVSSLDKAKSSRIGGGVTYTFGKDNFYGLAGVGYDWDQQKFGEVEDKTASPWADLSLQFVFKKKHSLSTTFHYSTWQPSSSYKSNNIIVASSFLKYTGNPSLFPYKSYDIGLDYTWIPNNRFNMSAFAYGWTVGDRYAFDYIPMEDGILRTIKQPIGSFADFRYGINASAKFLDNNLDLRAQIAQNLYYNGAPYNQSHSSVYWHAQLRYYMKSWHFSLTYISDKATAPRSTNGFWTKNKNDWQLSIGWAKGNWNFITNIVNMTRWSWRSDINKMHSKYYSVNERLYNGNSHALIQLSATYTFGYGRKIKNDNEPSVSGNASSGILK